MMRVLLAVLLLLTAGATLASLGRDDGERPAGRSVVAVDPHGAVIAAARTLVLSRTAPAPSRPGRRLNGRLVGGTMPSGPTRGIVLSDEDCAANAKGVSNCLNRIRLADGTEIAVRHPHAMSEIPCFAPGEPVRVVPA